MHVFWTILSFILIFMVVVVSHEFGHFLLARINGIKVVEFTIGLGPALFKKKTKTGMLFAIRLLPIGGACIFDGEPGSQMPSDHEKDSDAKEQQIVVIDEDNSDPIVMESNEGEASKDIEEEKPRTLTHEEILALRKKKELPFQYAPVYARIATVFAGPLFNVILAFLLSIFLCWFCGTDLPVLQGVMEDYPAATAGLQQGDTIRKINSQRIYVWREISMISMMSVGKDLDIEYERDGKIYETTITPAFSEEANRYYIGFIGGGDFIACNNISVFKYAAIEVRYWLLTTIRSIGYLFGGHASAQDLAGPVGVAEVIGDTIEETSQYGLFTVILNMINIAVLLSVNLGVMNLLPIPALDGGRLIFLLLEAVRGKPVPPEKEGIVHLVGMILLVILMVFVFFNDILRIVR